MKKRSVGSRGNCNPRGRHGGIAPADAGGEEEGRRKGGNHSSKGKCWGVRGKKKSGTLLTLFGTLFHLSVRQSGNAPPRSNQRCSPGMTQTKWATASTKKGAAGDARGRTAVEGGGNFKSRDPLKFR